jgi:protoporphyrinogen IX oxidase
MGRPVGNAYSWIEVGHIVAMTAWMAGLFYLPRLFAYHADVARGTQASELFKVMEARLLRIIMMPAMLATWLFGFALLHLLGSIAIWLWLKLLLVVCLSGFHLWLWLIVIRFAHDERPHGSRFFRAINEVPTLLLVAIVILVVIKPLS